MDPGVRNMKTFNSLLLAALLSAVLPSWATTVYLTIIPIGMWPRVSL